MKGDSLAVPVPGRLTASLLGWLVGCWSGDLDLAVIVVEKLPHRLGDFVLLYQAVVIILIIIIINEIEAVRTHKCYQGEASQELDYRVWSRRSSVFAELHYISATVRKVTAVDLPSLFTHPMH